MRRTVGLIAFALACLALLLAPLPAARSALWRAAQDAAHGPLFGLVAIVVLVNFRSVRKLRGRSLVGLYALTLGVCLALGLLSEALQSLSPTRSASLGDVGRDLVGATAALALHALWTLRGSTVRVVAATAIAALCAGIILRPVVIAGAVALERAREFPVLVDFDRAIDVRSIEARGATIRREPWPGQLPNVSGTQALRVELHSDTRYPGIELLEPRPDWSRYRTLVMELGNPSSAPLALTVRIDDALHDQTFADRYNGRFKVPPHSRLLVRISLASVAAAPRRRRLDLARIERLLIFRTGPAGADAFYLGRVWLEL